jgi:DNA polymerase-1
VTRYIFDIETDGLLDTVSRVHSLVLKNIDTGEVISCHGDHAIIDSDKVGYAPITYGLTCMANATQLVGHNVIKYDVPVLDKLYPGFSVNTLIREQPDVIRDTIVLTRLIWPDLKDRDLKKLKAGKYPGKLVNKHSLEAWGHRLGNHKGDYKGGWENWSPEMQAYCEQDIEVTYALYKMIEAKAYSAEAIELEHAVQWIIARQERYGVLFDQAAAGTLLGQLIQRRIEVEAQLREFFKSWEVFTPFVPKRDNKTKGWKKGVTVQKVKVVEFNPASRDHIANRLISLYGWKPVAFTDGGKPQVDEKILAKLSYPPARMLTEYLTLDKRIGQIADGKQAWLVVVKSDGRIHGSVTTNGAVTGRMTHSHPNITGTPKVGSLYGKECRALFIVRKGKKLVGADASGIELRNLAHFLAKWDGGAYAIAVSEGNQEDGTDVHSLNCIALGMEPTKLYVLSGKQQTGRNGAKTFIYAYLYGAGDEKIGFILGTDAAGGKKAKSKFLSKTKGLRDLKDKIAEAVRKRGYIKGLDGRLLKIRSAHAALNTLLQSAGAVIMKKALVILDKRLQAAGYVPGVNYEFVINAHDEWQIETDEGIEHVVGRHAKESIRAAGEHFKFRCPLDGDYKVGNNWAETH